MQTLARRTPRRRIVWLAAGESRSHLERAHVMRNVLARREIDVHIFTTTPEGADFLESLGSSATLLESDYRVEFDARQNLDRRATASRMFRYFADPRQCFGDLSQLRRVARHAAFVVNDFHPALLVGGSVFQNALRTVHLYGNNLWHAIARPFRQPLGRFVNPLCTELLDRLRGAGVARVIHRPLAPFEARWTAASTVELPPLVRRSTSPGAAAATRSTSEGPSIAVRLPPQFRDPAVARSIEYVADRLDADLHALGAGYRDRERWTDDPSDFVDRVGRADLLIAAPSVQAIGVARAHDLPTLLVVPDQPEQARNATAMLQSSKTPACRGVEVGSDRLYRALLDAAHELVEVDRSSTERGSSIDLMQSAWSDAFTKLTDDLTAERETPNAEALDAEALDAEALDAEALDAEAPNAEAPDGEAPDGEMPNAGRGTLRAERRSRVAER